MCVYVCMRTVCLCLCVAVAQTLQSGNARVMKKVATFTAETNAKGKHEKWSSAERQKEASSSCCWQQSGVADRQGSTVAEGDNLARAVSLSRITRRKVPPSASSSCWWQQSDVADRQGSTVAVGDNLEIDHCTRVKLVADHAQKAASICGFHGEEIIGGDAEKLLNRRLTHVEGNEHVAVAAGGELEGTCGLCCDVLGFGAHGANIILVKTLHGNECECIIDTHTHTPA